jgi:FeS assembly protein IscX
VSLVWEASYEIVLTLMATYPDVDLDTVSLQQLNDWIVALPDFDDDPLLVNDQILNAILSEWFEERHA